MQKLISIKNELMAKRAFLFLDMAAIRGGVNINASVNGLANAASDLTGTEEVNDDKRRSRPGGGVSTL